MTLESTAPTSAPADRRLFNVAILAFWREAMSKAQQAEAADSDAFNSYIVPAPLAVLWSVSVTRTANIGKASDILRASFSAASRLSKLLFGW
jgi:hypothetical protein